MPTATPRPSASEIVGRLSSASEHRRTYYRGGFVQEKAFSSSGQAQRSHTVQYLRIVGFSGSCLLLSASMALAGSPKDTVLSRGVSAPTVSRSGLPMFLPPETVLPRRGVRLHEEASAANVEPASSAASELTGRLRRC